MSMTIPYYQLSPLEDIAKKQKKRLKLNGITSVETDTDQMRSYTNVVNLSQQLPTVVPQQEPHTAPAPAPDEYVPQAVPNTILADDYEAHVITENNATIQAQIQYITDLKNTIDSHNAYVQQQIHTFHYNASLIEEQKQQLHKVHHQVRSYQLRLAQQVKDVEDMEQKLAEKKKQLEDYESRISYCKIITDTMSLLSQNSLYTPQYTDNLTVQVDNTGVVYHT